MFDQENDWLLKEKYHGEKSEAFFADSQKLKAGVPLAYLIGYIPFLNTKINLNSHPLIPRPETEYWVEEAIKTIQGTADKANVSVLDLCAGSGAIGVAVAKALPQVTVDFVELDKEHLPTIKQNCLINDIGEDRVNIYEGDLFKLTSDANVLPRYDFILSNPPYIDQTLNRVEKSVVDFEPALALYGGIKGLELITKIISGAPEHLTPSGQLWIEHEPEQSQLIAELGSKLFKVTNHKDQYQVLRYSVLVLQ